MGFSPLFESLAWGGVLAYLLFIVVLVPSSFLVSDRRILFRLVRDALLADTRQRTCATRKSFLRFPNWYREIVDHTTREERRKARLYVAGAAVCARACSTMRSMRNSENG